MWLSDLLQVLRLHQNAEHCLSSCHLLQHGESAWVFPDLFISVACLYSLTFFSCILDRLLHTFCYSLSNSAGAFMSWMSATVFQSKSNGFITN